MVRTLFPNQFIYQFFLRILLDNLLKDGLVILKGKAVLMFEHFGNKWQNKSTCAFDAAV